MKPKNRIYTALLLVLLVTAGFAPVGAVDVLKPWEEEFLEEYGESWMPVKGYGDSWLYDDYGVYWFNYYIDDVYGEYNETRYNELSQLYEELKVLNANVSYSVLETWEEEFLLEYGESWMYEDLANFEQSWIYLNYGVFWFDYYLDDMAGGYDPERYTALSQMYEGLKEKNTNTAVPATPVPTASIQNTTNTSALIPTNTTIQNTTNTPTPTPTNPTIQNTTIPTPTASPTQNVTVLPEPENGFPVVPVVIAGVFVLLLVIGAVVLVKRKGAAKDVDVLQPSETPSAEEKEIAPAAVQPEAKPEVSETPKEEPKTASVPATPKEWYAAVSASIAEKHGVNHVSSLTPRQLLEFGEVTEELKEFVRLYEQIRYSPDAGDENTAKLAELAAVIIKQNSA